MDKNVTNDIAVQSVLHDQLEELFPVVGGETQLESDKLPNMVVDLWARSSDGRLILFEVKALPSNKNLPFSAYPSIISLKESVSNLSPKHQPIVVFVTNGNITNDVKNTFLKFGVPVITLGKSASETKSRLRESFQELSIDVPEITSFTLPKSDSLSVRLFPEHTLERIMEYNSDLQIAYLIVGIVTGAILGILSSIIITRDLSLSTASVVLLGVLSLFLVISLSWAVRLKGRIKHTLQSLGSEKSAVKLNIGG